jgi:hypothetical protein
MERLTQKQSAGYDLIKMDGNWCDNYCEKQSKSTCNDCVIYEAIQKLAKYEDLEEKLHDLCKNGDENIIENIVNVFIETIFKGQKHEGFEILTNEDAKLYDEWLKTR